MATKTRWFFAESKADVDACLQVRRRVYIDELKRDEQIVFDGQEADSDHLAAAIENGKIVGTARLRKMPPFIKGEWMAVLKEYRTVGAGVTLQEGLLTYVHDNPTLLPMGTAQPSIVALHEQIGGRAVTENFLKAGVPMKIMMWVPPPERVAGLQFWQWYADAGDDKRHAAIGPYINNRKVVESMKRILDEVAGSSVQQRQSR